MVTTSKILCLTLVFLSLGFSSLAQSQTHEVVLEEKEHSFYCKACKTFLFDNSAVSKGDNEKLHFSGPLADHVKGGYTCSCKHFIGAYDSEKEHYKVSLDNVHKEDSGNYHCSGCHKGVFDSSALLNTDEEHVYFSHPIVEQEPPAADKQNYFKVDLGLRTMSCHGCEAPIGTVNDVESQSFDAELNPSMISTKN